MKILLTGAKGQLGSDLVRVLSEPASTKSLADLSACSHLPASAGQAGAQAGRFDLIPLTHQDLDILDYSRVFKVVGKYSPDILINTAAYHKVEECEERLDLSFQVNSWAVKNLAHICKELNVTLVHFSTDYVFDGRKRRPYREEDEPCPLNAYGISKLAGEYFIRYILKKYFIIRTSGLFGRSGSRQKGGNFVKIMLRKAKEGGEIKVVGDQIFSPTYTLDLAESVKELIETSFYGLYHITNSGKCSWYEFAEKIFRFSKLKVNPVRKNISNKVSLKRVKSKEFKTKALRPEYSVLGNYKLKEIGLSVLRPWDEALKEYSKG